MRRATRLVLLPGAALGVALAPPLVDVAVAQQSDTTWTIAGVPPIEIHAPNRAVAVTGWARSAVRVRWTREGDGDRLVARLDGDVVRIDLGLAEPVPQPGREDTLYVTVPNASPLRVTSTYGGIVVDDVRGRAELETYRGSATYRGGAVDVTVTTYFGDILVAAAHCRSLTVESALGAVRAEVRGGRIRARTLRGDIQISAESVDDLEAESTAGSIRVRGAVARDGRVSLDSHQGDVEVALPPRIAATFRLRTYSGAIENAFGRSHTAVRPPPAMTTIRFQRGSGSARVELGSFLGTVRLQMLPERP